MVLLRLVETHTNDSSADMWREFGEPSNGRRERGVQIPNLTYEGSPAHRIASSERSHHRSTHSPKRAIKCEVGFKGARVRTERLEGHDVDMFKGKKSCGRDGAMDAGKCVN